MTFKINEKGNFNFSTTRDSLVTLFNNTGLVYSDWYFLDEDLILFVAVNPIINIYIDDALDLDKYSSDSESGQYQELKQFLAMLPEDISSKIEIVDWDRNDVYDRSGVNNIINVTYNISLNFFKSSGKINNL